MLLRTVGTYEPRNMVSSPRRNRRGDQFHSPACITVGFVQTATYCNVARSSPSYKSETECKCEVLQAQSSANAQCLGDRVLAVNKQ